MVFSAGDSIEAEPASWTFRGTSVVNAFDTHVARSVPCYELGHWLVEQLSDFFLHDSSLIVDLGCSTGTLLRNLASRHKNPNLRFLGFDTSSDMLSKATNNTIDSRILYTNEPFLNYCFDSLSFISSYYTMQFIHPKERQLYFDMIYQSLDWGGAFLLFEKTRAPDARFQDITTSLYSEYKAKNGYTPGEIYAKSLSLRGVLNPYTVNANLEFLARAGFSDIMPIFKIISFDGFLCIK